MNRPVIGVVTAKVADHAQRQVLRGILSKARELDAETVVFSNMYSFQEYFAGTEVENRIYDLITSQRIDGMILVAESILNPMVQQYIYERIQKRNVPTVVIGAELPGMDCLNTDMVADFEEIARHLVEVHHFTKFDFLTGPKNLDTSYERIRGFTNVLDRHGITLPPEHVIYGDFWLTSGEKLGREYVEGKRRMPQALVCANDYMAYGVCDVLLENGIAIPEEMSIVGYEYAHDRIYHAPILTTYFRNREALGSWAVSRLLSRITGQAEQPVPVDGHIVCGDTCPCGIDRHALSLELRAIQRQQYYTTLNYEGNFEQQLTLCRSIQDYIHTMQEFAYLVRDCVGLYLCLYENWARTEHPVTLESDFSHAPMLCYRIISQQQGSDTPQFFLRDQLCPEKLAGCRSRDFFYFSPIFFEGRELGHFIIQYDKPDSYDPIFGEWLKIAANGLESLRMKNDIHALIECQNLSEHHDTATGLWNSQGFFTEMKHALTKADASDKVMLVLVRTSIFSDDTSIDGQSIQVRMEAQIAEACKKIAVGKHEFCAKLSDHLFCIGGIGNYSDGHDKTTEDCLCTLILHAPLYRDHCGTDTIAHTACLLPIQIQELDIRSALRELSQSISIQVEALSNLRGQPGYSEYQMLRNSIFREPAKDWNAQESCRSFHLSYGHFRATYKELFGVSFHQDVIACRISLAKHLLLTTSLSVQVIAYQCGYDDDKYFLRQFRQHAGCTPNAYRNQN